jgi:uncharacterized protein
MDDINRRGQTPRYHEGGDHYMPADSVSPSPLLQNLLLFVRLLRAVGLRVTSGQLIELASSLEWIDIGNRDDFKNAARSVLVNRQEDLEMFDAGFEMFWRRWPDARRDGPLEELINELAKQVPAKQSPLRRKGSAGSERGSRLRPAPAGKASDEAESGETVIALYSPGEVLRHKDFAAFTDVELTDAQRLLAEMRWAVARRRSLRMRPARRGKRLDVRRSIRASLRYGGELLDLQRRGPKLKRRQIVLLCDISGSMERYTRLLLHFLHSVETNVQRAEVFVFGTRLTRITPALRSRDPDGAIASVASQVQDWSGGTRIGESLRTFNRRWARRVLGHGAIVVIISDGWDRGDPELLSREMGWLQRTSYRLIWLNPLLGAESYEPLTQGIRAALPYIDDFLPIHNLASLEALGRLLNQVQAGRPDRRQVRPHEPQHYP